MSDLSRYRGARVLVLGALGFIGRHVARALEDAGAELHAGVRDRRWAERGRAHTVDLACDDEVLSLCALVRPHVAFDLAGYGVDPAERDPEIAGAINDRLAGVLARAMAHHRDASWEGQAIVRAGTAAEYGAASGDLDERTEPRPTSVYGRTKLAGTLRLARESRERALPAVTARAFTVYGPGEREGRLLPTLIAAARTSAPIPLSRGLQRRDFTYVGDVAEGLLRLGLTRAEPGEAVNLATGRLTSVEEFARTAARVLGIAEERLLFGALPTRAEEMEHEPVTNQRLRELTGWTPSIECAEGIRRTRSPGVG